MIARAILALGLISAPAAAQEPIFRLREMTALCGPADRVGRLHDEADYEEALRGRGPHGADGRLLIHQDGSWMMVLILPREGLACVVAEGVGVEWGQRSE